MNQDFTQFTAAQVTAHCQKNVRLAGSNPLVHQSYQRDALVRANQLEAKAQQDAKQFRAWRVGFVAPRIEAWGHLDEASTQALTRAAHSVNRVRAMWASLEPLLSPEEREQWLAGIATGQPAA